MSNLSEAEGQAISASRQLHDAARLAWEAKTRVITAYIAAHHPGQKVEVKLINLLAHDVCFPGAGAEQSRKLAQEVTDYLQHLLLDKEISR